MIYIKQSVQIDMEENVHFMNTLTSIFVSFLSNGKLTLLWNLTQEGNEYKGKVFTYIRREMALLLLNKNKLNVCNSFVNDFS